MATRKKRAYNATSRRSGSTTGRSSTGGSGSKAKSKSDRKARSILSSLRDHAVGRFFLLAFSVVCVVLLDFLISANRFDRFFLFLGIELILAVLFCWIRFVFRRNIDDKD